MIRGLGLDLVEMDRIRGSLARFGERFLVRVLTPLERESLPHDDPAPRVAVLFAAKEAAVKALGTGFSYGIGFHSLEITHLPTGQPVLTLHGAAKARAETLGARQTFLSLTHGRDTAAAVVVLEG